MASTENTNNLFSKRIKNQLEKWTGLHCGDILFDSKKDNWEINRSVFNERIVYKKQLAFVIQDIDGEIFGFYIDTKIGSQHTEYCIFDQKLFYFTCLLSSPGNGDVI